MRVRSRLLAGFLVVFVVILLVVGAMMYGGVRAAELQLYTTYAARQSVDLATARQAVAVKAAELAALVSIGEANLQRYEAAGREASEAFARLAPVTANELDLLPRRLRDEEAAELEEFALVTRRYRELALMSERIIAGGADSPTAPSDLAQLRRLAEELDALAEDLLQEELEEMEVGQSEALRFTQVARVSAVLAGIIGLIVSIVVFTRSGAALALPIEEVSRSASRFTDGSAPERAGDEVAVIANAFSTISERLEELAGRNRVLETSREEHDVLIREINHRVKNNLLLVSSLIHLKQGEVGPRTDLSDLLSQVEAIRLLHEELTAVDGPARIDLAGYLGRLVATLFGRLAPRPVSIQTDLPPLSMDARRAATIGLLVNEIATNAIKHGDAEEPRFRIALFPREADHRVELELSNNGSPMPAHVDPANPKTLGMRLIAALAHQLDAEINLTREPHPRWLLSIPLPNHPPSPGTSGSDDGSSGSATGSRPVS